MENVGSLRLRLRPCVLRCNVKASVDRIHRHAGVFKDLRKARVRGEVLFLQQFFNMRFEFRQSFAD